jgi:hypothetical protein
VWLEAVRLGPDVAQPTTDGREMLLVRRTEPERDVLMILAPLGLQLRPQPPPRIRAPPPFDDPPRLAKRRRMSLLTIVPPMPGAERRFKPFVDFLRDAGWETEFVRLEWVGSQPNFDSHALFPQVDAQTAGKVVMGFSLGALYSHLGAVRARHLILGSISPFFLEDDDEPRRWRISYRAGNADIPADVLVGATEDAQMHRRAAAVRDFYRHRTYTVVHDAEHELWHPNYLQAIKAALDRLGARTTAPT